MRLRFLPRPLDLVATALLTTAGVGCSAEGAEEPGSTPAAAVARTPGCELLTAEEIAAATGTAPARTEWDDTTLRGCSWYQADGRPLLGLVVGAAPPTYDAYVTNLQEQTHESGSGLEGVDTSVVAGIGDYAIWHEAEGSSYLNAARGGELFVLMIFREPASGRSKREAVLELAAKGVPRL